MTVILSKADDTVAASTGDSACENKMTGLFIADNMAESTGSTNSDKSNSGPGVNKSLKDLCWKKYMDCGDACILRRFGRIPCYAGCFDTFLLCYTSVGERF